MPVAKALGFGAIINSDFRHIYTGLLRLSANHLSVSFTGLSITLAPDIRLAVHLKITSEINEPLKLTTPA
jgi:hypothetical protein